MFWDITIPIINHDNPQGWTHAESQPVTSMLAEQVILLASHIDVSGMIFAGGQTIEQIDIDQINGKCLVVKIPDSANKIELKHIKKLPIVPGSRIIFKTNNSLGWRKIGHPPLPLGFSQEAALHLADRRLKLIGVDGWSVDQAQDSSLPVHQLLLKSGTVVLESLCVDHVVPGEYKLHCLPLLLVGAGTAPCRAVLEKKARM